MTTSEFLRVAWDWEPSVVAGCLALVVAYAAAWLAAERTALSPDLSPNPGGEERQREHGGAAGRGRSSAEVQTRICDGMALPQNWGRAAEGRERASSHPSRAPEAVGSPWRAACFLAGVAVLLLALVSPLDVLGDTYLFSMHMAQHLLLIEVVPPLLLLGVPPSVWRLLLRWPVADRAERLLRRPWLALLLSVGTLWAWHAPTLYEFALDHENVHIGQHLSFLVTATIFWWLVIAPLPERQRLGVWQTLVYVAFAAFASSTLGIILTFSPPSVYPSYLRPVDTLRIVPLLRDGWGLTPLQDQRLGGGLMWMAGGFVYLLALVGTVMRWYTSDDDEETDETWRARRFDEQAMVAGPAAGSRAG